MKVQRINLADIPTALNIVLSITPSPLSDSEVQAIWGVIDALNKHLELHFEIKQCTKCGRWYPATEKFWRSEPHSLDGFKYHCNKCLNKKRSQQAKKARQRKNYPHMDSDVAEIERFRQLHEAPAEDIDPVITKAQKMMREL